MQRVDTFLKMQSVNSPYLKKKASKLLMEGFSGFDKGGGGGGGVYWQFYDSLDDRTEAGSKHIA